MKNVAKQLAITALLKFTENTLFTPLTKHEESLAHRFKEKLRRIHEYRSRLDTLKRQSTELETKVRLTVSFVKDCINRAFIEAVDALVYQKASLLQKVKLMESVYTGDEWDRMASKLDECSTALRKENAAVEYYANVSEYENIMQTIDKVMELSSEGGVLAVIDRLNIGFVPNQGIALGYLRGEAGWYFKKKNRDSGRQSWRDAGGVGTERKTCSNWVRQGLTGH